MKDNEVFKQWLGGVLGLIWGTPQSKEVKDKVDVTKNLYNDMATTKKPKRARIKGRYKADDKSTPDVNEAWVGGKAPKRDKGIGYKK